MIREDNCLSSPARKKFKENQKMWKNKENQNNAKSQRERQTNTKSNKSQK